MFNLDVVGREISVNSLQHSSQHSVDTGTLGLDTVKSVCGIAGGSNKCSPFSYQAHPRALIPSLFPFFSLSTVVIL